MGAVRLLDLSSSYALTFFLTLPSLPEVGNLTGKRRKATAEDEYRSYVVPDSILVGGRDRNAVQSSLDQEQMVRLS